MLVPVVAPRIRRAAAQRLERVVHGMIPPHRATQRNSRFLRRARCADFAGTRRTASTVEPAIGAEAEAVREIVVVLRRQYEAIEHHFGGSIRHAITIAI